MAKKTFKGSTGFLSEPNEVKGVNLNSVLFDLTEADAWWFGTTEGGACCLPSHGDHSAFFDSVTPQPSVPFVLKDAAAVAGYVYHAAGVRLASIDGEDLVSDVVLQGLVALAIFPGYASPADEAEPSALAIDRLLAAFHEAGVKSPLSLLSLHVLDWGRRNRHFRYVMGAYPSCYLGPLAAHGLQSQKLLKSRYALAMSEGWTYQLQHSDADYESPWLLEYVFDVGRPTVESVSPTRRRKLLAASGFSEQQFCAARESAIAQTGSDRGLVYLQNLTTNLARLRTEIPSSTDGEI